MLGRVIFSPSVVFCQASLEIIRILLSSLSTLGEPGFLNVTRQCSNSAYRFLLRGQMLTPDKGSGVGDTQKHT